VGRLRLLVDGGGVHLEDYQLIPVDDRTPPMPEVQQVVDALQMGIVASFGDLYHDPIAWAEEPISDAPARCGHGRDTPIGDLWTDAYRAATGTQIAVEADGFLDEGIPAGVVVGADILRTNSYGIPVFPEDGSPPYVRPFRLATFRLRGAELIKGIEIGLASPGGVFLQVSGMRFAYDSSLPPFSRVIPESVRIGGRRVDPNRSYSVTANEGVVMFLPRLGVEASAILVRDVTAYGAARALIEARGELEPRTDGRIRDQARQAVGCTPPKSGSRGSLSPK
jgi:2',3'-cyclic-nucleotide 2'-phosphodiesterase (5'-nucleotidase family)